MNRRRLLTLLFVLSHVLSAQADSNLADIERQIEQGQYAQALSQLDTLLAADRHNPQYQFNRARALAASGRYDEAIAQYQALIKAYPDLPESYNNLAVIYQQRGQVDKARTLLEQAMQGHAGYARVYQNLKALNAARARDAYAKALQIPPGQRAAELAIADRLVLQQVAIASVRQAPAVKPATKPLAKTALNYQAKNSLADKKTIGQAKPTEAPTKGFAEASAVLQQWARAWSGKDVDQYLGFYGPDYSPAGMSRHYWEKQRRRRINKPKWIQVKLRNIRLHASRGQELVIRLEQAYAAGNYSDVTRKEFVMQRIAGEWRITKERGLGYLSQ